jgi:hypothetical protein
MLEKFKKLWLDRLWLDLMLFIASMLIIIGLLLGATSHYYLAFLLFVTGICTFYAAFRMIPIMVHKWMNKYHNYDFILKESKKDK